MKYRFLLDEANVIQQIIEYQGNTVYAPDNYDILITTLENAKANFQAVGIDIQPILDFEANL